MAGHKVAIIGAGRLAALLAGRIPAQVRKVIISRHRTHAAQIADEVGGIATDQMSAVRGCQAVFLAVPGAAMEGVVREMAGHLDDGTQVVNMAMDADTGVLRDAFPEIHFTAAKLVGDPAEMQRGEPGLILLDHVDHAADLLLRNLLADLGVIVQEDEAIALAAARAIALELSHAAAAVRRQLGEYRIGVPLADTAMVALGPAVIRALAGREVSAWLRSVVGSVSPAVSDGAEGDPLTRM